MADKSVL